MTRIKKLVKSERGIYEPAVTEEHVVRLITEGLWRCGIKVYRIRERIPGMCSRKNLSTPGIPDLVGWIPRNVPRTFESKTMGTMTHHGCTAAPLFIEVKKPGGARRPVQERFIAEASADGCIAFFAEGWQDCVTEFARCGIKLPS